MTGGVVEQSVAPESEAAVIPPVALRIETRCAVAVPCIAFRSIAGSRVVPRCTGRVNSSVDRKTNTSTIDVDSGIFLNWR